MKKNIHPIERIIRIIAGFAILSLFFILQGNAHYWGLVGFLPLITGLVGWCPPYAIFGINTCKTDKSST